MTNITDHTNDCTCPDCIRIQSVFSYENQHEGDRDLALIAMLLDRLEVFSCTVVGYRGNTWTITDSRG